jgi:hypothetical protein
MPVPYSFKNASGTIPLSQLDDNFATTALSADLAAPAGASSIGIVPTPTIASTTVADAINELDTEKATVVSVALKANSADLAASTGATLVGFQQTGSTIPQTVDSKLKQEVSVLDFGADPTGVANSTAAFNNAILYLGPLGGGKVLVPTGTYLVDRKTSAQPNYDNDVCIDIQYDNIHLVGDGVGSTIIKKAQNTISAHVIKIGRRAGGVVIIANNCSVSQLTIYGNRTTVGTAANSNLDVSSGCSNITISDIQSLQSTGYGLAFQRDNFVNCTVRDIKIEDCNGDGIDFKCDTNGTCYGNTIENVTVVRFGLAVTPGVPQGGVNIRTGVNAFNIHASEYGAENCGFRIDTSLDTTLTNRSMVDNIKCICDGGTNSKGIQISGKSCHVSNVYCSGAEINYWIRSGASMLSNIVSIGGKDGVYIYAATGNDLYDVVITNAIVSGASEYGVVIAGTLEASGASFVNLVTYDNVVDVFVGTGISDTRFIGGRIGGTITDNGTNTVFFGIRGMVFPLKAGRSATQNVAISGDSGGNYLTGVSASGSAKVMQVEADANSSELRLTTKTASSVSIYTNSNLALSVDGTRTAVVPGADNITNLGASGVRFKNAYLSGQVYIGGNQLLTSRDTGWVYMTGTSNKTTAYDTSTVTLAQLAARVKYLEYALSYHGLIGT